MKKLILALVVMVACCGCLEELSSLVIKDETVIEFNGEDFVIKEGYVAISKESISKVLLQYGTLYDGTWREYGKVHVFANGKHSISSLTGGQGGTMPAVIVHPNGIRVSRDRAFSLVVSEAGTLKATLKVEKKEFDQIKDDIIKFNDENNLLVMTEGDDTISAANHPHHFWLFD